MFGRKALESIESVVIPTMSPMLNMQQVERHAHFKRLVEENVLPMAESWDQAQSLPDSAIALLAANGFLGSVLPRDYGGQGWDIVTFGLLNEAFGRGSSSLTGVLTVQTMISMTLLKWGTDDQKRKWLPPLCRGEIIGAFALTEPGAGSALQSIATDLSMSSTGETLLLNGTKRWITCGQIAKVFLVFGKLDGRSIACLVPKDAPGLEVEPIGELMGFRAAGLAQLNFKDVAIPSSEVVGKPGFAFSHVAPVGLQYGRISTACSALGLLRGCFEESAAYANERRIGERFVGELGTIRAMMARMGADLQAGQFLCLNACRADDERLPEVFEKTLVAKYFTSRAAVRAASDAVQIRGASGVHGSSAVSRFYRDAKIMEIIEGTTQVHEELLGKIFLGSSGRPKP